MDNNVVNILLEIQKDLSAVGSDVKSLKENLSTHSELSKKTAERVGQLEKDAWKLKGAIALAVILGLGGWFGKALFS
jgi:hypothetical protein